MPPSASTTLRPMTTRAAAPMGSTAAAVSLAALRAIIREMRMRRDMNALARLDDHHLSDIGLVRSQIEDAVRSGRVSPLGACF